MQKRTLGKSGLAVSASAWPAQITLRFARCVSCWRSVHLTLGHQFISNPAFNQARGPVSVLGARLHWSL